jgi:cysteine dioxygenase
MQLKESINIYSLSELLNFSDKLFLQEGSLYYMYKNYNCSIFLNYTPYISFSDINYKRNLMCSSDNVDIYLICWKKGQRSKIHDHPEKGCIVYVLDGELIEKIYHKYEHHKYASYNDSKILTKNDSTYNFGSNVLHQITATCDTISLHIYQKGYLPKCYDEIN